MAGFLIVAGVLLALSARFESPETEAFGYVLTPSPTADIEAVWADIDCSAGVTPVDALLTLRVDAGLPVNTNGCPEPGIAVPVQISAAHNTFLIAIWGDADCEGGISPVDSLVILRNDAGLGYNRSPSCPTRPRRHATVGSA